MGRLEGEAAIVTGAGRGIGRAIALVLAQEGAAVAAADIDLNGAGETARMVQAAGGKAVALVVDVRRVESVHACVGHAIKVLGKVSILVNNAGVVGHHIGEEATLEDWDWCYEVNLKGVWTMCRAAIPHFREQGRGKIVNISSIAGRHGYAALPHYGASKAGVINLTQSLARELGKYNINVNAVCPGVLWTEMWQKLEAMFSKAESQEAIEQRKMFERFIRNNCPLGREQSPEDVGKAVAFLVSEEARNITGQALNVDGGIELN